MVSGNWQKNIFPEFLMRTHNKVVRMSEKISVEFGELVSVIVNEIGMLESEQQLSQISNTGYVRDHYQRGIVNRLRRFFDKVEEREHRDVTEELDRQNQRQEKLKETLIRVLESPEGQEILQTRVEAIVR